MTKRTWDEWIDMKSFRQDKEKLYAVAMAMDEFKVRREAAAVAKLAEAEKKIDDLQVTNHAMWQCLEQGMREMRENNREIRRLQDALDECRDDLAQARDDFERMKHLNEELVHGLLECHEDLDESDAEWRERARRRVRTVIGRARRRRLLELRNNQE